jgi:hypothetical protein
MGGGCIGRGVECSSPVSDINVNMLKPHNALPIKHPTRKAAKPTYKNFLLPT